MARLQAPPAAGRLVATGFVVALLALFMARLMVQGGWAMPIFWVALPVVFLVLVAVLGWVFATFGAVFFASAVFAFRLVVRGRAGWVIVLLAPVVVFTGMLAYRTIRRLRAGDIVVEHDGDGAESR